ncbi:beta-lactamase family protein [Nonomuraea gerenzanensis]|uniref:D-alanyl-D-alanine carboxypeptidase n=1 Tax=Nonomuraea gerenzanensis TaxID=93944 RepID=A0A1M4EQK7_9ACTN|nr:beta-lactamase family protein [Nonomuraea gerenzanensis]UBU12569.1 beta-lactamase family protein [Nonomuraea gerenzanensis]SBP01120.1 D-alanyl-D-alanine carboxypeptidase [Nonomuraea gerenzanensis]
MGLSRIGAASRPSADSVVAAHAVSGEIAVAGCRQISAAGSMLPFCWACSASVRRPASAVSCSPSRAGSAGRFIDAGFTGVTLRVQDERGEWADSAGVRKLGLDDSVAGYLPEYGLDERITVRMLLQHTSGLGCGTILRHNDSAPHGYGALMYSSPDGRTTVTGSVTWVDDASRGPAAQFNTGSTDRGRPRADLPSGLQNDQPQTIRPPPP